MSILTDAEIRRIETKYCEGITSAAVVKIFKGKGQRFSEATLRKYVQLGLLPTSRRVGIKGKHRGSSGLYPAATVRLANDIKRALDQGQSLEDIGLSTIGLKSEVQMLHRSIEQVFGKLQKAALKSAGSQKMPLKQVLQRRRKGFDQELKGLSTFVDQLSKTKKR